MIATLLLASCRAFRASGDKPQSIPVPEAAFLLRGGPGLPLLRALAVGMADSQGGSLSHPQVPCWASSGGVGSSFLWTCVASGHAGGCVLQC